MSGLKVLGNRSVSLQRGASGPLDFEDSSVPCLEPKGLCSSTVPTVPSRVHVTKVQGCAPALLNLCPSGGPSFGRVIRHRRGRLDLLSEGLRHPIRSQCEPDCVVVWLVLQAGFSSS
eukprot:4830097-Amphidinium_carterae.1